MNRNRLPRWVNAVIDAIADAPMSPIGRVAARRMGKPAPRGRVPATSFAPCARRVLITPVNYSGQATAWARSLGAELPDLSARSAAIDVPGGFSFPADLIVPVATFHNDPDWQHRQFEAAAGATHVLIEAEEPLFGRLLGRSVEAQAEALRQRGVDVAFMAHGTDVRLPSRHVRSNPWSHFADTDIYVPRLEALAARNIALLSRFGAPVFVSTPDLLRDLPDAQWCPVVIEPGRWHTAHRDAMSRPMRVAHAPSVGAVKGTELMMPVLERLASEGVIALDLVRGVPSAEMPEVFQRADVVIDQLRIGSYGVAACEAMAAGAVVVGHVSDAVRDLVSQHTGRALPIVEANPESIESALRGLAARDDLSGFRAQGLEFVREIHDGRRSAEVLRTHWIERDRKVARDASDR